MKDTHSQRAAAKLRVVKLDGVAVRHITMPRVNFRTRLIITLAAALIDSFILSLLLMWVVYTP